MIEDSIDVQQIEIPPLSKTGARQAGGPEIGQFAQPGEIGNLHTLKLRGAFEWHVKIILTIGIGSENLNLHTLASQSSTHDRYRQGWTAVYISWLIVRC